MLVILRLELVCEFHLGRSVISDECKCSDGTGSYYCLQGKWNCKIYICHAFRLVMLLSKCNPSIIRYI